MVILANVDITWIVFLLTFCVGAGLTCIVLWYRGMGMRDALNLKSLLLLNFPEQADKREIINYFLASQLLISIVGLALIFLLYHGLG